MGLPPRSRERQAGHHHRFGKATEYRPSSAVVLGMAVMPAS